jgi:hypothetical protein
MIVLIAILGIIFFMLDKYHFPCKKKVSLVQNCIHIIHNMTGILVYIGPFILTNFYATAALLCGTLGLLVQGVVNPNKEQSCFLMPIYNRECGLYENRQLYDIFSLFNIKNRLKVDDFNKLYYSVHLFLLFVTMYKLSVLKR